MPTAHKDRTSTRIGSIVDTVFAAVAKQSASPQVYIVSANGKLVLWPPEAPAIPSEALEALALSKARDVGRSPYATGDSDRRIIVYALRDGSAAAGHAIVIER